MLVVAFFFANTVQAFPQAEPYYKDTKEIDRDIRSEVAKKMETAPKAVPKVKPKEETVKPSGPTIFVSKINLIGVESFKPESFSSLVSKYENKNVTRVELDALARNLQREYLERGVISACFIPPQKVKDGVVTLQVIEAKMGKLIVKDRPFFSSDRMKSYWTTAPGQVLRYDKMSKNLQIMNTNPDREIKASLSAGEKPGTTDVILDAKTTFPIHVTASYDNEGGRDTGRDRKGIGVRHNNVLFVDDTLIAGYSYGSSFSNVYAYHKVPFTNFGTSAMYGYSYSKSAPKKDQSPLGLSSLGQSSSFFLYQDLFVKEEYIGEANVGIDFKDKSSKVISGVINRERMRMIRAGTKLICKAWGGVTHFVPNISQGINGFGSTRKGELSSRKPGVDDGVENTPTIFRMDVNHKRQLPFRDTQLSVNFKCQVSSEKLPPQEGFSIGGIDSVRGYPAGDFSADDAFQTNVEFLVPASFIPDNIRFPYGANPINKEITFLAFYDYAHGERKGVLNSQLAASPFEKRIMDYSSIGAGIRIRFMNQGLIRLEWGYPIGGNRAITEGGRSRFHFSVDFEDQIPEEVERIKKEVEIETIKNQTWAILNNEYNNPNSDIRMTLDYYMWKAEEAKAAEDLVSAKSYYEKAFVTTAALYNQTEAYVQDCKKKEKELKECAAQAKQYFEDGDLMRARELWEKVIKESRVEPLKLKI